jgi:hypothetical protein
MPNEFYLEKVTAQRKLLNHQIDIAIIEGHISLKQLKDMLNELEA